MGIRKERSHLKPQDALILLKLLSGPEKPVRLIDLAYELGISQSEVSQGLERLRNSRLVDSEKRKPLRGAAYELLVHALKYVFPVSPGPVLGGLPTAHSAKPLSDQILASDQEKYVWPCADGETRGQSIEPLYPSVPKAARLDPQLYELLALVDAIRVGRAREQKLAQEELKKRILKEKE